MASTLNIGKGGKGLLKPDRRWHADMYPKHSCICLTSGNQTGIFYPILDFDAVELERSCNSTSPKLQLARSSCSYAGKVCEKLGLALRELLAEHQASAGACHPCQTPRNDKVALSLMGAHAWRQCWQSAVKDDTFKVKRYCASRFKLPSSGCGSSRSFAVRLSRPLWEFLDLL